VALTATGADAREFTVVIGNRTVKATPLKVQTQGRGEIRGRIIR